MKKLLKGLGILFVLILAWLYFKDNLLTSFLPPYVSVVSGSKANNYKDSLDHTNIIDSYIPLDPKKFTGLTQAEADSRQVKFYATKDGSYALMWGMPYGAGAGARVIDVKKQTVSTITFPETPAYVVDYVWMGNNLLLHYYSESNLATGSNFYADIPRIDHYYLLNPSSGKFTPISADSETSQYTAHGYGVALLKQSDDGKNFALSYCEKMDHFAVVCNKYGFSISNGVSIKHLFDINGQFKWGWKDNVFIVAQDSKTYLTDFSKISW